MGPKPPRGVWCCEITAPLQKFVTIKTGLIFRPVFTFGRSGPLRRSSCLIKDLLPVRGGIFVGRSVYSTAKNQFILGSSGASESKCRWGLAWRIIVFQALPGMFISINSRVGARTSHVLSSISCSSWPGDQPEQPSKIRRPLSHPSREHSALERNVRKATTVGFSRH